MKRKKHREKRIVGILLIPVCVFLFTGVTFAADDATITEVLRENHDLFLCNDIFNSAIRSVGWWILKGLSWIGAACAELFDKAFLFVDFTQVPEVQHFINSWKPIFIALICASILFLGLILIFWHEKKPKLIMNICLAILIVSSGTYLLKEMNTFLAEDVRGAVIGQSSGNSSDMVYALVGDSVYDLKYLDQEISGGLMNLTKDNRKTLENLAEEDVELIEINEILKPDDVQDSSKDLMGKRIDYNQGATTVKEIYNGVAWTDLLNEYYYRYNVSWFSCIIGLISIAFIYICLAYKVVRILAEIVIHQLLAYLYSSNLTSSQKTLKILESIKDSYITLILVLVCVRIYTMAYYFVTNLNVNGFTKTMMLLFIAFVTADGPNLIQKLTGIDAGLSGSVGKLMALSQGGRALMHMGGGILHGIGKAGGAAMDFAKDTADKITGGDGGTAEAAFGAEHDLNSPNKEEVSGRQENLGEKSKEYEDPNPVSQENREPIQNMPEEEMGDSGFRESMGTGDFEVNDKEMPADTELSGAEHDLNGMNPGNGDIGNYKDLDHMEKELRKDAEHMDSGLGSAPPPHFEGGMFHKPNLDELEGKEED